MTATRRQPADASVHLWQVDLDVRGEIEADLRKQLSPAEIAIAENFASPDARRRYIVARGTLRLLLGTFLDERPEAISIEAGPTGKPYLTDTEHGIHFNVSHSADMAMICIATCGDVGVDLESVRRVPAAVALARRHFAPAEASFVEQGGSAGADGRFLLCWTRKEALAKAIGAGLNLDLRSFTVPLTSPGAIVPIDDSEGGPTKRWLLIDVPLGREYVAALAVALSSSPIDHGTGIAPGSARARHSPMDHCEEIDVLPRISSTVSSSTL